MDDRLSALRRGLGDPPADPPRTRPTSQVAAALALFAETDGDLELVLTRRHDDLTHHPGQISFPGGRVEPGESVPRAALREAAEECRLDPSSAEVLGSLPAFFLPPSRYWLHVVAARWRRPHPLTAQEAEVAQILHVRVADLCDPDRWRAVAHPRLDGMLWGWDLGPQLLLWGATGGAVEALLTLLDPGWQRGLAASDLPADRVVDAATGEQPG